MHKQTKPRLPRKQRSARTGLRVAHTLPVTRAQTPPRHGSPAGVQQPHARRRRPPNCPSAPTAILLFAVLNSTPKQNHNRERSDEKIPLAPARPASAPGVAEAQCAATKTARVPRSEPRGTVGSALGTARCSPSRRLQPSQQRARTGNAAAPLSDTRGVSPASSARLRARYPARARRKRSS